MRESFSARKEARGKADRQEKKLFDAQSRVQREADAFKTHLATLELYYSKERGNKDLKRKLEEVPAKVDVSGILFVTVVARFCLRVSHSWLFSLAQSRTATENTRVQVQSLIEEIHKKEARLVKSEQLERQIRNNLDFRHRFKTIKFFSKRHFLQADVNFSNLGAKS